MAEQEQTASARVFSIRELVDAILSNIEDPHALIRLRRVCASFQNSIENTPETRQALFLNSVPNQASPSIPRENPVFFAKIADSCGLTYYFDLPVLDISVWRIHPWHWFPFSVWPRRPFVTFTDVQITMDNKQALQETEEHIAMRMYIEQPQPTIQLTIANTSQSQYSLWQRLDVEIGSAPLGALVEVTKKLVWVAETEKWQEGYTDGRYHPVIGSRWKGMLAKAELALIVEEPRVQWKKAHLGVIPETSSASRSQRMWRKIKTVRSRLW